MTLYSYWRSTTSYRVRAALALKSLAYTYVPVNLLDGAQHDASYATLNPSHGVPTLVLPDGTALTQSLAIIDYLDAIAPPQLVPTAPIKRAQVLAVAHTVALDIHPLTNLRVMQHLQGQIGASEADAKSWLHHWVAQGFAAAEELVDADTPFAFGDEPDLADICILSQCYNARRWGIDLAAYPRIAAIEAACNAHPDLAPAHPDKQPDAA